MDSLLDQAADGFLRDPIIAIGNLIALSYLIPLVSFVIQYWRKSPWWVTDLGVALMAQKVAFILVFILIDLGIFLHDWPARQWVRLVLYSLVAVSLWLDQVNLTRYQRRYPHSRRLMPRPSLRTIVHDQIVGTDTGEVTVVRQNERTPGA